MMMTMIMILIISNSMSSCLQERIRKKKVWAEGRMNLVENSASIVLYVRRLVEGRCETKHCEVWVVGAMENTRFTMKANG